MVCRKTMKRAGMVIGTVSEKMELYRRLHDGVNDDNREIVELLKKHNYQNYNIFLTRMDDGKEYLFAYYEYIGDDFDADNAELATHEEYRNWIELTGTCQKSLHNVKGWKMMEHIFYME